MDRRELMLGLGAMAALPRATLAGAQGSAGDGRAAALSPLAAAAREAYIYTLPLIESAGARATVVGGGAAPGTLFRLRQPTTPATQRVTTPNNDTLNARGWVDLSQGPVRLTLPATGDRYVSIAMMDMFSNNFAVLGTRTTGPAGGTYTIVGPGTATNDPRAIRSPTPWMWLLIRLLTSDGHDLAPARAMQDRFVLEAPAWRGTLPRHAARDAAWPEYFASAARLLAENPAPATDDAVLRRIAPLALERFEPARFSAAQGSEIARGVADAKAFLVSGVGQGPVIAGWAYPRAKLGNFAQDYGYRAQTALNGFAALPVDEAMYMFATGPRGDLKLDGRWRLRLPADRQPPVDAFWSLTMYRATADGQFFLTENAIDRYSIGDRTPGLLRGSGGALEILIQHDRPADAANWLPAPAGPFGLVFRTYRPRAALLDGRYRLPPLERV